MKQVIAFLALFISMSSIAQSTYEKGMNKGFKLWGEGKSLEASNVFERISNVEKENWIPLYYVAQINILDGFTIKEKTELELKLEKVKTALDKAKALSPNNPELMVLEALYNTVWIAFDGATYGMTLGAPTTEIYKKALELAPDNPRVVYCYAEWNMGMASYFGKDTTPYCQEVKKAIELFSTFKNETPFYPSWGKDRAEQIYNSCNK
ncbi:hypothetical protein NBRC110019_07220 [Neptunitalea chrysea]|uniref:Tetratricopeptide repeat protein n=1 Tax=Neptunitalea chrysea TaxID=1647581 RepID=A0A9W6EVL4_9FLAO|nr:hypothetical protein [Neptunitalea chrysea]GLB51683.1 hypothetical protein NBRC110019_07220 [Neptunitalea chrysea]